MAAPLVYRSTDSNAPALFGGQGSLTAVLEAILVNGYGSTFAVGTLTGSGVNVSNDEAITIGSQTYTFKNTLSGAPPNSVLVGATIGPSMQNLLATINGVGVIGSGVSVGTVPCPEAWASGTGSVLTITARKGGSAGNSIVLGNSVNISRSGSFLTGGGGTDSKAGAGWSKPFTGAFGQAVFKQPAGCGFYIQVDDTGPNQARDARCWGWETMTAYNTGTAEFPTPAQNSSGVPARKSNTIDGTTRSWICFVDDRTFYLFLGSGDGVGNYHGLAFGDFYSLGASDNYKCFIMGGSAESSSGNTQSTFAQASTSTSMAGHWLARNYTGLGGGTAFIKNGDGGMTSTNNLVGSYGFPNPADGGLYVAPVRITDGSTPSTSISGTFNLRGRLRGFYHICHTVTSFADGDSFVGSGEYAGRSFYIVRWVYGTTLNVSMVAIETTAWDTSS